MRFELNHGEITDCINKHIAELLGVDPESIDASTVFISTDDGKAIEDDIEYSVEVDLSHRT